MGDRKHPPGYMLGIAHTIAFVDRLRAERDHGGPLYQGSPPLAFSFVVDELRRRFGVAPPADDLLTDASAAGEGR